MERSPCRFESVLDFCHFLLFERYFLSEILRTLAFVHHFNLDVVDGDLSLSSRVLLAEYLCLVEGNFPSNFLCTFLVKSHNKSFSLFRDVENNGVRSLGTLLFCRSNVCLCFSCQFFRSSSKANCNTVLNSRQLTGSPCFVPLHILNPASGDLTSQLGIPESHVICTEVTRRSLQ